MCGCRHAGRPSHTNNAQCGLFQRPSNERDPTPARLPMKRASTLIEVLMATAADDSATRRIGDSTAQWLPNWTGAWRRVQRAERLALGPRPSAIVGDLSVAQMIPINGDAKAPLFEGSELAVTFVRTAIVHNARPGLEITGSLKRPHAQGPCDGA